MVFFRAGQDKPGAGVFVLPIIGGRPHPIGFSGGGFRKNAGILFFDGDPIDLKRCKFALPTGDCRRIGVGSLRAAAFVVGSCRIIPVWYPACRAACRVTHGSGTGVPIRVAGKSRSRRKLTPVSVRYSQGKCWAPVRCHWGYRSIPFRKTFDSGKTSFRGNFGFAPPTIRKNSGFGKLRFRNKGCQPKKGVLDGKRRHAIFRIVDPGFRIRKNAFIR